MNEKQNISKPGCTLATTTGEEPTTPKPNEDDEGDDDSCEKDGDDRVRVIMVQERVSRSMRFVRCWKVLSGSVH